MSGQPPNDNLELQPLGGGSTPNNSSQQQNVDQGQSGPSGTASGDLYPDINAPVFNVTTSRSASHKFLRQKLVGIREVNPDGSDQASAPLGAAQLVRDELNNQPLMSPLPGPVVTTTAGAPVTTTGPVNTPMRQRSATKAHFEEYDFQFKDTSYKPMTQAEYNDVTKKKETSLNLTPSVNNLYMIEQYQTTRSQRLWNGAFRWIATVIIAILTGLMGAALRIANARVNAYKFLYSGNELVDGNYIGGWGIFVAWSLLMLMCSTFIVLCIEIKANGSGIPDVKAYLNGCNVRGVFTTKTLVTKLISSAFTINATVPSGLQGPVIHLGSITGGWIATWFKRGIMRVFCCARPFDELRNDDEIPPIPNPTSVKIYKQGYFQAVHEEHLHMGAPNTRNPDDVHLSEYTANDIFLQAAGVKLLPNPNSTLNYPVDDKGLYHSPQYPPRTDINAEGKPTLRLEGGGTVLPVLIDNLTIDNDIVPVTNTGKRKLAQFGVIIEAPKMATDDELAGDFAKQLTNPNKFGDKVNANGGVMGLVIKNKKINVKLDLQDAAAQSQSNHDMFAHNTINNVVEIDPENVENNKKCLPKCCRHISVPNFDNDLDRREFISIGSSAGVAGAMGAIVGGILFAFEEMSTHWSPMLGLRALAAAAISCLVAQFFSNGNSGLWAIFQSTGHTFFIGNRLTPFRLEEIPLFLLLGVLIGLIGAAYIFIAINIMRWRNAIHGTRIWSKFVDTAILCIIFATLSIILAFAWPCDTISPDYAAANALSVGATAGTYSTTRFDCPEGFHNKFAGLSFVAAGTTIKRLFARGIPDSFELPELVTWSMFYTIFCAIIQQTNASYGLMVPVFMMGASWGRTIGKVFSVWFGYTTTIAGVTTIWFDPGVYAVVGAAAAFAAITRSTLSMTLVVLEMTADISLVLPCFIGSFIAQIVSQQFSPSMFVSIINERKLPYLTHDPPNELYRMTAKQIMSPQPIVIGSCERVDHLLAILESSGHSGYPVVLEPCTALNSTTCDSKGHIGLGCDKNFLGMVQRRHLLVLLNRRVWRATSVPFNSDDFNRVLSRAMPKLGELRARLTSEDLHSYVDLLPWVNRSDIIVSEHMLAAQAFTLFRSMGLCHLPVINSQKHITGIITRLEFLERVVQHRWLMLRKLEHTYIQNGGSSLAQQYVDGNTAYVVVSTHSANFDALHGSKVAKRDAYTLSFTRGGAKNGSNNNSNSNATQPAPATNKPQPTPVQPPASTQPVQQQQPAPAQQDAQPQKTAQESQPSQDAWQQQPQPTGDEPTQPQYGPVLP